MVLQTDPLIGGAAPQEDGADDMQHVLLQYDPAVAIDVGIGEIDRQSRIVVAQIGAEQPDELGARRSRLDRDEVFTRPLAETGWSVMIDAALF